MSILPLFIWRVACSAGRSWCRRAGSCSSAGVGDWTDWGPCPEEEEEVEDMVEGVEPKAAGAEFRLWEEEEEEEWPELDAVDWSPDVVSVEIMFYVNMSSRKIYERVHVCVLDIIYLLWLCPARPLVCSPCLGENYWLPSWLSLSVFVPWNKSSRTEQLGMHNNRTTCDMTCNKFKNT